MNFEDEGSFGDLLARYRTQARLSQEKLAQCLGVTRTTIVKWESKGSLPRDRTRIVEIARCLKLAEQQRDILLRAALLDPSPTIWHVPNQQNPFFTGREDILQSLDQTLVLGATAALTQSQAISGLGGIGKTQTALEYAYRHRQKYHDVLWLQADSHEILSAACVKLAQELGLPQQNEADQPHIVEALRRWLRSKTKWLLILDNVEDPHLVEEFVPSGHRGSVLLTTRASVTEPVAFATELEKMTEQEGVCFLLRRIKILAPTASIDERLEKHYVLAKKIWELMDGLPLALDQAGAYILETKCDLSGYIDLYQRRQTKLLALRGKFSSGHPESVFATFSLALEKVVQTNKLAGDLLRLCALLHADAIPEEILIEGATYFGSCSQTSMDSFDFNEAVRTLLTYALIHRDSGERTFTIHRLVQVVLRSLMEEEQTLRQCIEHTVRAVSRVFPSPEVANWPSCRRIFPHVQACITLVEQEHLMLPEAARLFLNAGIYASEQAQYEAAERFYRYVLAFYETTRGLEDIKTGGVLHNLAMLYQVQEKYEDAELLTKRVLSITQKLRGPFDPSTLAVLHNVAEVYRGQGKEQEAEQLLLDVLSHTERVLGPEHLDTAANLFSLSQIYRQQQRFKEEEQCLQRALSIRKKALGPEHPVIGDTLEELANYYSLQHRYEEAELLYKQALTLKENIYGLEHPKIIGTLHTWAMSLLLYEQGRDEEAKKLFDRALHLQGIAFGVEHPNTIEMWEEYYDFFWPEEE